eukprot:jgi/Hompol1/1552/HPOL_005630-RA
MKHGIRFWQKKLGRSPQHRKDLMRNLLSELIEHERINTTVAKAKFLRHEMETMINIAKRGEPEDWDKARESLYSQESTVPKLMKVLAERYRDRRGGYVRIVRNGFNSSGSDRAPRAIIELVSNPRDLTFGAAKVHGDKVLQLLQQVEGEKYHREQLTLHDPESGAAVALYKLHDRHDISGKQRLELTHREVALHKRVLKMRRSLLSYDNARQADARFAHLVPPISFEEHLNRFQTEVDKLKAQGRKPSEKFKDRMAVKGFELAEDKVVVMQGVSPPSILEPLPVPEPVMLSHIGGPIVLEVSESERADARIGAATPATAEGSQPSQKAQEEREPSMSVAQRLLAALRLVNPKA